MARLTLRPSSASWSQPTSDIAASQGDIELEDQRIRKGRPLVEKAEDVNASNKPPLAKNESGVVLASAAADARALATAPPTLAALVDMGAVSPQLREPTNDGGSGSVTGISAPGHEEVTPEGGTVNGRSGEGQHMVSYPEGGLRAWLVVVGSTTVLAATFGLMTAVGLFQVYWATHQLKNDDATRISWIISVFGFLSLFLAAQAGALFDKYGARWLLIASSAMYTGSFLGLAYGTTYAHFMGCFAVAGIAASVLVTIAFSVINHWFQKRKGLAMGVATMGSGLGGIFFSISLKALFERLVWRMAVTVLFAILLVLLSVGVVCIQDRFRTRGELFDFSCFKSLKFVLFTYAVFGFEFVLYTGWGLLPTYAVVTGLGDEFVLMMVFNVGSTLGRLGPGYLADKWGSFNVAIVMSMFTLLTMLIIWLPFGDQSVAALYIVGALLGVGTGSFVSTAATCLGHLSDADNSGKILGTCNTVVSIATLTSNPISQAVLARAGPKALVAFQAAVLFSAFVSCIVVRWACLDYRWQWFTTV